MIVGSSTAGTDKLFPTLSQIKQEVVTSALCTFTVPFHTHENSCLLLTSSLKRFLFFYTLEVLTSLWQERQEAAVHTIKKKKHHQKAPLWTMTEVWGANMHLTTTDWMLHAHSVHLSYTANSCHTSLKMILSGQCRRSINTYSTNMNSSVVYAQPTTSMSWLTPSVDSWTQ